jgi:hypothetical protein
VKAFSNFQTSGAEAVEPVGVGAVVAVVGLQDTTTSPAIAKDRAVA